MTRMTVTIVTIVSGPRPDLGSRIKASGRCSGRGDPNVGSAGPGVVEAGGEVVRVVFLGERTQISALTRIHSSQQTCQSSLETNDGTAIRWTPKGSLFFFHKEHKQKELRKHERGRLIT